MLTTDITTIVEYSRRSAIGWASEVLERRDTALLLMGYTGAFRRGELVALECRDVRRDRLDGAHVRIRKSKTDQDGTGAVKALPFTDRYESCPVCAWVRWLQIVAAFDTGGRVAVIRMLARAVEFDSHICRGTLPVVEKRSPLFRSVRKNGNLSDAALSGAAVHAASAAALLELDTTPSPSLSLAGIPSVPASSRKLSATELRRMRSCAKPGTPHPQWSKHMPASTPLWSATRSPSSAYDRAPDRASDRRRVDRGRC